MAPCWTFCSGMLWHALSNVPAILALLAPGRRTTSLFSCLKYPRTESDTAKTWQILVFIWCSSMFIINSMNVHQWFIRFHQRKPWVPTWDWVLDTWSLRIQRIPWLHPSMDPRHISLSTEQHQDTLRNLRVCKYIQRCLIKMIKYDQAIKYVFYSFLLYRFLQRHLRSCMCICTLMEFHRTHTVPCDTKVVNSASWSAIGIVNELHQEHVILSQTIIHSKYIIIYPHIYIYIHLWWNLIISIQSD